MKQRQNHQLLHLHLWLTLVKPQIASSDAHVVAFELLCSRTSAVLLAIGLDSRDIRGAASLGSTVAKTVHEVLVLAETVRVWGTWASQL
jgi:hypothetical protein